MNTPILKQNIERIDSFVEPELSARERELAKYEERWRNANSDYSTDIYRNRDNFKSISDDVLKSGSLRAENGSLIYPLYNLKRDHVNGYLAFQVIKGVRVCDKNDGEPKIEGIKQYNKGGFSGGIPHTVFGEIDPIAAKKIIIVEAFFKAAGVYQALIDNQADAGVMVINALNAGFMKKASEYICSMGCKDKIIMGCDNDFKNNPLTKINKQVYEAIKKHNLAYVLPPVNNNDFNDWLAKGDKASGEIVDAFNSPIKLIKDNKVNNTTPRKYIVPIRIREIKGVLGEVAMIHNRTSIMPQADFAISTALAFASACYGRYIETPTYGRAVLLMLNTGVTGSGKEHSYTVLDGLFTRLQVNVNCEHGISSERAVYQALEDNPNTILLFDEVWKLLGQANAGKGSAGQGALASIMTLYGKAGAEIVKPPRRANVNDTPIHYPSLTMLASSTIEKLGATMEVIQSVDGFTNRLIIVDEPNSNKMIAERLLNNPRVSQLIDESLSLKDLVAFFKNADASKPIRATFDKGGKEEFIKIVDEYNDIKLHMSDEGKALFQRSLDNSTRVASLLAVSIGDYNKPVVTADVIRWSWEYVSFWAKHASKRFEFDVFNTETEKARQSIKKYLSKNENGTGRSSAEIRNKCRTYKSLSPNLQDNLLNQMCREGELGINNEGKATKYHIPL